MPDAHRERRGKYSGWLTKAKQEDGKRKWLCLSNMRWFTIDFDNQVMFYSHSKAGKRASDLICFRDIRGAALVSSESEPRTLRRSFSGTLLRRSPSSPELQGECKFTVHLQHRTLSLTANSSVVALWWVDMLNTACMLGLNLGSFEGKSTGGVAHDSKFLKAAQELGQSATPSESSQASRTTEEGPCSQSFADGSESADMVSLDAEPAAAPQESRTSGGPEMAPFDEVLAARGVADRIKACLHESSRRDREQGAPDSLDFSEVAQTAEQLAHSGASTLTCVSKQELATGKIASMQRRSMPQETSQMSDKQSAPADVALVGRNEKPSIPPEASKMSNKQRVSADLALLERSHIHRRSMGQRAQIWRSSLQPSGPNVT